MNYRRRGRRTFAQKAKNLSVTAWLIIINILIYLFLYIFRLANKLDLESFLNNTLTKYFVLVPTDILNGKFLSPLILHMFTHIIFIHLFVNMFVLFSLGSLIEKIIGRKRFIWFYLLSGLFAGILSVLMSGFLGTTDFGIRVFGSPAISMMGASGAIFAIAGLYVILLPKMRFMIIFLPFFSFPAYVMIPLALFGLWLATIIFNLPIGNVAHFGGFLAGIVYGSYLRSKYKRKVKMLQKMFR